MTTCTNHQEKYEHEMAIALRSVLDMEDDDIAAMLKEKMLGLTEHLFFFNHLIWEVEICSQILSDLYKM